MAHVQPVLPCRRRNLKLYESLGLAVLRLEVQGQLKTGVPGKACLFPRNLQRVVSMPYLYVISCHYYYNKQPRTWVFFSTVR